ncbi:hypothetical protein [Mycolicibacterium palauense]|uniref:hypothetical protein n=1 Tax=Mycolicibacterium palauense TaxID=2034511 RepID=UPI002E1C639E
MIGRRGTGSGHRRLRGPGPCGLRRVRMAALAVGSGTAAVMGLIGTGCTTVTDGTGVVDAGEAPAYRASMSASASASAATSSARESRRQESLTTEAVYSACETMSTTSADAIDDLNGYVDAMNSGDASDATVGRAADGLNRSADLVESDINDTLPSDLRDALYAWSDAARATAGAVLTDASPSDFNDTVTQLNDSRANALNLCDGFY